MSRKINRNFWKMATQLLVVAVAAIGLWGCGGGGSSFDTPNTADAPNVNGAATNVLVDAATLKSWMDDGLVNGDGVFDSKVVIFDFGGYTMDPAVDPERIQGACRVTAGSLNSRRVEGVATAYPLVATGEQMDAVIQQLGIDENTIIVFTTAETAPMFYATRAYWMFRYWGFSQDQLRVLDGGNKAFRAVNGDSLMTRDVPVPVASTFSVKDLADDTNNDLRLSIGEMLGLVANLDTDTDVIIDARGGTFYSGAGSSPGYVTGKVDYVVYDGHPEGGQYLGQGMLFNTDGTFKSKTELETLFADNLDGWSPDKMTTVYCLSGYSATPIYFALETIIGAPARLYDGSWSQFGQYSDFADALGELDPVLASQWATDRYMSVPDYRYNVNFLNGQEVTTARVIETLQLDADAIAAQPSPFNGADAVQSQVEAADETYAGSTATVTFSASPMVVPALDPVNGVMIDEADLIAIMADPAFNAGPGAGGNIVLLDVTDDVSYARGHIPGAQLWDTSEHSMTRVEGPAPAVNMVLDGASMDEMLQKHGIDEDTTIVITSSASATYFPSRAYFVLRYWGVPRENIRVLNGYNGAWTGAMSTLAEVPTRSTLSVSDIADVQLDSRVSLSELMDAVRDGRGVPVDFRGAMGAAGTTTGVFSDVSGDYVVFDGLLNGGQSYSWKQFNVDYAGGDFTFLDGATIAGNLTGDIGIDGTEVVYSYCKTAYVASAGFFVLDGILGWPVMNYDGSWSQWGKMSDDAAMGGELPAGSEWATDSATYMSVINYNFGTSNTRLKTIESLNPDPDLMLLDPSDPEANQVEETDSDYMAPAAGGSDTGSTTAPDSNSGPILGC